MPIKAVTIDFWNTIFDSSNGEGRNRARRASLMQAIIDAGHQCDEARFDEAYRSIWEYFDHHWLEHRRTPNSEEMVDELCRRLDAPIGHDESQRVATIFSRGVLDHPPQLLPGASEAIAYLAERAQLVIISDTAFSPGSVLKELMMESGVGAHFSAFIFSDETGVAKPHPEAFRRALEAVGASPEQAFHIGDIERTDIVGARSAGMKSVLYRGDDQRSKYAEDATVADMVMHHWNEIVSVFERLSVG